MATTPILIHELPEGVTATVDIYADGSDTKSVTGRALTAETNRKTIYGADITESLAGHYIAHVIVSSVVVAVRHCFTLADDTSTHDFQPFSVAQVGSMDQAAINAITSATLAGTGPNATPFTVKDDENPANTLQDAAIYIYDGTTLIATGLTSLTTQFVAYLPTGAFTVHVEKANHYLAPQALTVPIQTQEVTYTMAKILPVVSTTPNTVTGRYFCQDKAGLPEVGVQVSLMVNASSRRISSARGLALSNETVTASSGAGGWAYFTNLTPGVEVMVKRGSNGPWVKMIVGSDADDNGYVSLDTIAGD